MFPARAVARSSFTSALEFIDPRIHGALRGGFASVDSLGLVGEGAMILQQCCQFYEAMERVDSEGEN